MAQAIISRYYFTNEGAEMLPHPSETKLQRAERTKVRYTMACDYPIPAIMGPKGLNGKNPQPRILGKRFDDIDPDYIYRRFGLKEYVHIELACGKCEGCRLDYAKSWTVRLVNELHTFPNSDFITLTYSDEHLPKNGSIDTNDFRLFMRRLRHFYTGIKEIQMPDGSLQKPIRYYCGHEYSPEKFRAHSHAILFNFQFPDKVIHSTNNLGQNLYTSARLTEIWGKGHCTIGDVTAESCGYTARYIMKKQSGYNSKDYYKRPTGNLLVDPDSGEITEEILEYTPEKATMTTQPGLGYFHYKEFQGDFDNSDTAHFTTQKGHQITKVPRYYNKLLEKSDPKKLEEIKQARIKKMLEHDLQYPDEKSPERRAVKAIVRQSKTKALKRKL
jgi:hypothetical protein